MPCTGSNIQLKIEEGELRQTLSLECWGWGYKDSLMSHSKGAWVGPAWPLTCLHCFPPRCSQPELSSGKALVGLGLWQGEAYLQRSVWLPDSQASSCLICV